MKVSEGVLQGGILSSLLFIIFLSDIVDFFRSKSLTGINIDGVYDLLMPLYADDIVMMAHSPVHSRKKLEVLYDHCMENGLGVDVNRTKIMVVRSGGRMAEADCEKNFKFHKAAMKVVHTYLYLGVMLFSSALGTRTVEAAITQTKMAAASVLFIIGASEMDSWSSIMVI